MSKYTAADYEAAINAAKDIREKTGRLSSTDLLNELISRTGKPRKYWHMLDIMLYIKGKENPRKKNTFNREDITEDHIKIIIEAAEVLKKEDQEITAINSARIKMYIAGIANQTKLTRDVLGIPGYTINEILIEARYNTRKQNKPRGAADPRTHQEAAEEEAPAN